MPTESPERKPPDKCLICGLLAISVLFAGFAAWMRFSGSQFFYSLFTRPFEGYAFSANATNYRDFFWSAFKSMFSIYAGGYLLCSYVVLLPAIVLLAFAIGKVTAPGAKPFRPAFLKRFRPFVAAIIISVSIVIVAALHFLVLQDYPLTCDEFSYLFQADVLSSGKFYAPSPPYPEHFVFDGIVSNGKWYSKYAIGWPLLLALGKIVNIVALVGSLCAGLSVLLLFLICRRIYGERAGWAAVIIALASPMFTLLGASYFPHTAFGLAVLAFIYALLRLQDEGNEMQHALIGGAALFFAVNIRLSDGVALVMGYFLYLAYALFFARDKERLKKPALVMLLFLVLGGALTLAANYFQTGNALVPGYIIYNPKELMGRESVPYTVYHGMWNFAFALMRIAFWIFPFLGLLAIMGLKKKNLHITFLAILCALFQLVNFAFFGLGSAGFGMRFYYIEYIIIIILASGGIINTACLLSKRKILGGRAFVFSILSLSALCMIFGVYLRQIPPIRNYYTISQRQEQNTLAPADAQSKSIVFIRTSPDVSFSHTSNNWNYRKEKCLRAIFLDPGDNKKLVEALGDRTPFVADWDFEGKRFVVSPYPAGEPSSGDYFAASINYWALPNPSQRNRSEEEFRKATGMPPGSPAALFSLGLYYFKIKNYEKAAGIFGEIVRTCPDNVDARNYLNTCLQKMGKTK